MAADEDEGHLGARGPDPLQQLQPRAIGHAVVAQHQVEAARLPGLPGHAPVRRGRDLGPGQGQSVRQHVTEQGLVFGQQDPPPGEGAPVAGGIRGRRGLLENLSAHGREAHLERRAAAR